MADTSVRGVAAANFCAVSNITNDPSIGTSHCYIILTRRFTPRLVFRSSTRLSLLGSLLLASLVAALHASDPDTFSAEVPVRLLGGGEGGQVGLRGGLVLSGGEALGADGEGLAGLFLDDLLELQVQEVTPPDAATSEARSSEPRSEATS